MNHAKLKWITLAVTLAALLVVGACKKKVAPTPPAPPPEPPAAPTATLTISPSTIERGQKATLTWQTSNATSISIDGSEVQPSGSWARTPVQATTYRLVAKGPGGTQEAVASITVTEPPPPPVAAAAPSDEELFGQNVSDIYFSFDKFDVRMDQQQTIRTDAQFLTQHPNIHFVIEGHCDDRGSVDYNLALGDSRANSAKQALVNAGVSVDRIQTLSTGKEKPFCTEHTRECWQQNRRAHMLYQK